MVAITTVPPRTRVPSKPVLVVLPPDTRPGARVYRRRRLAVSAAAVALVVLGLFAVSLNASGPASTVDVAPGSSPVVHDPAAYGASGQSLPARAVYIVQPGDTIWSIAHALEPSGDTRAMVDRIEALNGGAALEPGQRLRLTDAGQ